MNYPSAKPALFLSLAVGLTGCASLVDQDQPGLTEAAITVGPGQSVGQTIVARHAGVRGVELYLAPEAMGSGEMYLHLRSDPAAPADLAIGGFPAQAVNAPGYYRFSFTPQRDSAQRDYYLLLEVQGESTVRVGTADGNAYLDGALYRDGIPQDAQLAFRLVYEPTWVAWESLVLAGTWFGILMVATLIFVLPGWALATLVWPGFGENEWVVRLSLAIGLSLALYPVLFLWTDLTRLHLGALYAWVPMLLAVGVLLWRSWPWRGWRLISAGQAWLRSSSLWPDLALAASVGLIFATRFYPLRSLAAPMWGDSYQHAVIAQLLVDHGGLFDSWQPYADLQTFTYHFGFHAVVAVFHWLTGFDMPQATLWVGQLLNGLACLTLYPLAMRVGANRWAGVGAVMVSGLFSPMPMFYLNWGRYAQLAGQAILPSVVYLMWRALESQARDGRLLALSSVALGGLALTHYRVFIFAIFFPIAYWVIHMANPLARSMFARTVALFGGAALLTLPWWIHIFAGKIVLNFAKQLTTPAGQVAAWTQQYNAIGDLFQYLPAYLWLLLPLSIGLGLWRRQPGVGLVSLWWLLLLVATNPQWLRLPGAGAISNFALFIAAYIPAGILVGGGVSWLVAEWRSGPSLAYALGLALVALGIWAGWQRLRDVRVAEHALVTRPDLKAADWIRAHTPQEARFLVNSFFAYNDSVIVGSDAGWWLPLLARRSTSLPPLNYGSEEGPRPDYRAWVNALAAAVQAQGVDAPAVRSLLQERGITHVYIGQRRGQVNAPDAAGLRPEQLLASPLFRPIYHRDRVWVFEIEP